jgi:hypothetical protein
VNGVIRRHEADHQPTIDSNCQMVARVGQELFGPTHVDRVVKNIRRDLPENARVLGSQNLDFDRHDLLSGKE